MLFKVAFASLINRRLTALLTVLAITVSVFVYLSVEHIRDQAKASFGRTVSGVDLIVGPRTGQLNLLLASVFRVGSLNNAIKMEAVQQIAQNKLVTWSVPLSFGDSHKGFPLVATTSGYFEHYQYGDRQALEFATGRLFTRDNQLVLGASVAKKLGYELGTEVVMSHGLGVTSFSHHEQYPFEVSGILLPTGTPVDQSLFISLAGAQHMHDGEAHHEHGHDSEHEHHTQVEEVSAVLLGLKAKFATLVMQQAINKYKEQSLMAIIPGVALSEMWRLMGSMEKLLLIISALVLLAALLGMSTMLLASMRERKREIAILRAMGARPGFVFTLVQLEVLILTTFAIFLAYGLLLVSLIVLKPWLASHYGIFIDLHLTPGLIGQTFIVVLSTAFVIGLLPAISAYRQSLQTGLNQ